MASVFPSPHDTPHLFRIAEDARSNQMIIEFKYIDEEPRVKVRSGKDMQVWLGRNSHRLYRMDIFVKHNDPISGPYFLQKINEALEQLEQRPSATSASVNYELLKNGIFNESQAILASLARK
jgi:hypothetical protein